MPLLFILANDTQYVNCTDGDVRLVGGDIMNEGNVQICHNNAWGSVCDNNWDTSDSNVVCYQLGLQPFGKETHNFLLCIINLIISFNIGSQHFTNNYFRLSDSPPFVIGALSCSGTEESLLDCSRHTTAGSSLNCQSYDIAGVRCIG